MARVRLLESICIRNIAIPLEKRETFSPMRSRERRSSVAPFIMSGNNASLVNSFYTLEDKKGEVIYVSEISYSDVSPDFQSVSLPPIEDRIFIFKLWSQIENKEWCLLLHYIIDMKKLVPIVNTFEENFNTNALVFKIKNKWSSLPEFIKNSSVSKQVQGKLKNSKTKLSYTFESIRSLNSLNRSLIELAQNKCKVINQIEELSCTNSEKRSSDELNNRIQLLTKYIDRQKVNNDSKKSEITKTKVLINELNELIHNLNKFNNKMEGVEYLNVNEIPTLKSQLSIYPNILKLIQESILVVSQVFNIENINNSVKFQIMGLEFPSTIQEVKDICYYDRDFSNYNTYNDKIIHINTGISFISQVIDVLANLLGVNLKYPIKSGNTICNLLTNEEFPLYYNSDNTTKNHVPNAGNNFVSSFLQNIPFEIALQLLNKNLISIIAAGTELYNHCTQTPSEITVQQSIPLDCTDNFLWNLKFLMLLLTAK